MTINYQIRGNLSGMAVTVDPSVPTSLEWPIDLPSTMEYDGHNRMVGYGYTDAGETVHTKKLKYGPLSRVYRKEEWEGDETLTLEKATQYYYSGAKLVQEYYDLFAEEEPFARIEPGIFFAGFLISVIHHTRKKKIRAT